MNSKGAVLASAAAMLLAGCGPTAPGADGNKVGTDTQAVKCEGINECKGTSECAGKDGNGCQGLNECKGHGWITTDTAEECTTQGGSIIS